MTTHRQSLANAPILVDDDTGLAIFTITSAGGPTNTVGEVSDESGNVLPVKTAVVKIEPGAIGNNLVLAAVVGKKLRVLGYNFGLSAASDAQFVDGAAAEMSAKGYGVLGGEEKAGDGQFLFETGAGQALNLVLSAAVNMSVQVQYVEV